MLSINYIAVLSAALTAVVAIPVKRDLVVNTVTEVEVVTEVLTATVWVDATDAVAYVQAQATHEAYEPFTSPTWAYTTHAAQTTSSSIYVAPPAPTSTSTTSSTSSSTTPQVTLPAHTVPPQPAVPAQTSTSSSSSSSTSVYVAPPVPATTSTSVYVAPTSIYTPPAPTTSTTTLAAAATTTSSSSSGSAKTYSGQLTFYDVGLGSCGYTNADSEAVVAMAVGMMDKASMCGKSVTITYGGVTKTAQVVDTCMGCANGNLDMSPTLFEAFAPLTSGRVGDAQWWFN